MMFRVLEHIRHFNHAPQNKPHSADELADVSGFPYKGQITCACLELPTQIVAN
jgi:hypothetical protein